MDAAVEALTPQDPVVRVAWMFDSDWVELGDLRRRDDYEEVGASRRSGVICNIYPIPAIVMVGGIGDVVRTARFTCDGMSIVNPLITQRAVATRGDRKSRIVPRIQDLSGRTKTRYSWTRSFHIFRGIADHEEIY